MPKKLKEKPLSQQLRDLIADGPVTRYRIAKEGKVDASQLCRFMQGKGQLTFETLDRVGQVLKIRFVSDLSTSETKGV